MFDLPGLEGVEEVVIQGGGGGYPVLPLRDIVVFPHMIVPLFVGREKSIRALEEVMRDDKQILLATQKNAADDDPAPDAIYDRRHAGERAAAAEAARRHRQGAGRGGRARAHRAYRPERILRGRGRRLPSRSGDRSRSRRWPLGRFRVRELREAQQEGLPGGLARSRRSTILQARRHGRSHLAIKIADKQELLEILGRERLEKVLGLMESEISVLQVEKRIRSRVKRQMEKTQREYYLNEQMKAIQKELGDGEDERDDSPSSRSDQEDQAVQGSRDKATGRAQEAAQMSPMSAEATVVRNYLDWLLSIPWGKRSKVKNDLGFAESVLDDDHYGLEKVKERIVEYLAVQSRPTS
jgi:ATP-dependent Lon protease